MTLSDEYKNKAISLGLCEQWTNEWEDNSTREEMIAKFIRGNDFCIKHNFPSVEKMKSDWGDIINDYGIYCDQDVSIEGDGFVMLCGNCKANILIDGGICDIYIRHGSKANVHIQGAGKAFIRMYDDSSADIDTYKFSKAFVYKYSDVNVTGDDNVVIRDRTNIVKK